MDSGTDSSEDEQDTQSDVSTDSDDAPDTREPWLWPFAADSIWNMPIGADAEYAPANLRAAGHAGEDVQHILVSLDSYPEQQMLESPTWGPGRCTGTAQVADLTVKVPNEWIVPDAGSSPYGNTPNSNWAILLPDGDTVFEGSKISRCAEGGPVYVPDFYQWPANVNKQSIRGNGLEGGGQGASAMSALGGTIRLGELTGEAPIRHAIKINPYAAVDLYYSAQLPGYKWPAMNADNYAADTYGGSDPNLVMGALLAIPQGVSEADLDLETEAGRKLFFTMQHFGVYFTEDAAWDTWDIIVERDVEIAFETTYGFAMNSDMWKTELNKLMQALHVVTNNTPESIGGGGDPLYELAPAFNK